MSVHAASAASRLAAGLLFVVVPLAVHSACGRSRPGKAADRVSLRSETRTLAGYEAEPLELAIIVRNEGAASIISEGSHPCLLSYHLFDGKGRLLRFDNPRTSLPGRIAPGREAAVRVRLKPPLGPGSYRLEFDVVREGRAWFKDGGSPTLALPLEVAARDWPEDKTPFEVGTLGVSRVESSVPEFNQLFRLIRITLRHDEVAFPGRTGEVRGFNAGAGYPQIWLRDAATILPASRYFYGLDVLRSWLLEHLARQGEDGGLEDWVDARGAVDKNTVETDQEASAVLAAAQVARIAGLDWLEEPVAGTPALQRLDAALEFVRRDRWDQRLGMVTGAHTADWGDVEIGEPDQRAIYAGAGTHWTADIYDQSMFVEAARALAGLQAKLGDGERARTWTERADALAANTNRRLWQEDRGFYRMHIHLDALTHPFDEDDIFAMGGNVHAIRAGIADVEQTSRILKTAVERQARFGVSTVSGVLLPPYPAGFFQHPILDEPYEYQNGGQWDWFGGKLVLEMFRRGMARTARAKLLEIARKDAAHFGLSEWDTRDGAPRGSDFYAGSAGSLAQALVEGYFGVRLDRDSLSLEPRLGTDSGRIHVDLPACGRFAAYDYKFDASENRVTFRFASNVPGSGEIRILSPWPLRAGSNAGAVSKLEVSLDGRPVPFRVESVVEDDDLIVPSDYTDHTISIRMK
jgi:hypothetical protein